ncbi:MAG: hypothetical protein KGN34_02675 [Sphingomonadales bacterium]|nr:hypothetical protein [Sphingomonadales bacterium]
MAFSFVLLIFSNCQPNGEIYRGLAIAINIVIAAFSLIGRRSSGRLSFFEICMLIMYISSAIAIPLNDSQHLKYAYNYCAPYTVISFVMGVAMMLNARSIDVYDFYRAACVAAILTIFTIYMVYPQEIWDALTADSAERWAMRFSAFNNHPNLEGFIFGGYAVICLYSWFLFPRFRFLGALAAALSVGIIFAASSRGGLVAVAVALGAIWWTVFPRLSPEHRRQLMWISVIGLALLGVAGFAKINEFISTSLELDSNTRGLASRGTGRLDNWSILIPLIFRSLNALTIGGGLRWAEDANTGVFTENSYLTIFLDSGLIVGSIIILCMIYTVNCARIYIRKHKNIAMLMVFGVLVCALAESMFNRYLLAIGNPFSVIVFYTFCYGSRLAGARK